GQPLTRLRTQCPSAIPTKPAGWRNTFARQAGLEIVFSAAVVRGVRTPPLAGDYAPRDALERLVAGTLLRIVEDPQTGIISVIRARDPQRDPPPPSPSAKPRLQTMKRKNPLAVIGGWLALALAPALSVHSADNPAN